MLARLIVSLVANALALWAAATYISGFHLEGDLKELAIIALILWGLNVFLKPVLTLFFGPIIILTLGLGLIAVNAFILYILDLISENITIENTQALLLGTLLIGVINFIFHLATHPRK